jgi:putative ABC transport system permease protein
VVALRPLFQQVRANLVGRGVHAVLLLLIMTLAAYLVATIAGPLRSASSSYDRLFERTNGAHLAVYLNPDKADPEAVARTIGRLPGVAEASGVVEGVRAQLFSGDLRYGSQELRGWPADDAIAHPLLTAGRPPRTRGEIVLDGNAADQHGAGIGTILTVSGPSGSQRLSVVGLALSSENCPYPGCVPARHWVASEALPVPAPDDSGPVSRRPAVLLRLSDPDAVDEIRGAVGTAVSRGAVAQLVDHLELRRFSEYGAVLPQLFLSGFSIVIAIALAVIVSITVQAMLSDSARQFALLRAIGFTPRQVASIYAMEFCALAAVGAVLGTLAAAVFVPNVLPDAAASFGQPTRRPSPGTAALTVAAVLAVVGASVAWSLRRLGARGLGTAMSRERARHIHHTFARLPVTIAAGLREVWTRPGRAVATGLGLLTAVFALTFAAGAFTTARSLGGFDYRIGWEVGADIVVSRLPYVTPADTRRILTSQPDVAALFADGFADLRRVGETSVVPLRVRQGDAGAFDIPLLEGRLPTAADEMIVGYGLASDWGVGRGDSIDTFVEDVRLELRVVGVYRDSTNQGRTAVAPASLAAQHRLPIEPSLYVIKLAEGAEPADYADRLRVARGLVPIEVLSSRVSPVATSIPTTMAQLGVPLAAIAITGLLNIILADVEQRRRQFALLKSAGMTRGQVARTVLVGATAYGLTAFAVGLPVGLLVTDRLLDRLGRVSGIGPITASFDGPALGLLAAGTLAIVLSAALLPAWRASQANVSRAVRNE